MVSDRSKLIKFKVVEEEGGTLTIDFHVMRNTEIDGRDAVRVLGKFIEVDYKGRKIGDEDVKTYFVNVSYECDCVDKRLLIFYLNKLVERSIAKEKFDIKAWFSFFNIATLAIVIAFLTGVQGFLSEYFLLKNFGLNIATYASVDYFVTAGVASLGTVPLKYFLIFSAYIFAGAVIFMLVYQMPFTSDIRNRLVEISYSYDYKDFFVFVVFMILMGFFIVGFSKFFFTPKKESDARYEEIVNGKSERSSIMLKTNNHLLSNGALDFSLITVTDTFMIFYQHSNEAVLTLPIENVSWVSSIQSNEK